MGASSQPAGFFLSSLGPVFGEDLTSGSEFPEARTVRVIYPLTVWTSLEIL
jgi:hypothetical protein